MRNCSRVAGAAIIGSVLLLASGAGAQAAEVRVLAIGALPAGLAQLGPQFEQASGHRLIIQYGATPQLIKRSKTASRSMLPFLSPT
jgi:molybdate transport system substrate-binding protein